MNMEEYKDNYLFINKNKKLYKFIKIKFNKNQFINILNLFYYAIDAYARKEIIKSNNVRFVLAELLKPMRVVDFKIIVILLIWNFIKKNYSYI